MFGSTRFQHIFGDLEQLGTLTFPSDLALNDADDNTGVVPRGKLMGYGTDITDMAYASGENFVGLLMQNVDHYGTTGDAGFRKFSLQYPDISAKRGTQVSLLIPKPGCIFEFEGPASQAASVSYLLVTSGAGALSAAAAPGTKLGCINGALRLAQIGDLVVATVIDADRTPKNTDEIRIRVQFVGGFEIATANEPLS
jgi:hypothetical protein